MPVTRYTTHPNAKQLARQLTTTATVRTPTDTVNNTNYTLARSNQTQQLYTGYTIDETKASQIPVIYGEVLSEGIPVYETTGDITHSQVGQLTNAEQNVLRERHGVHIMSEGPCEGFSGVHFVDQVIPAGVRITDVPDKVAYTVDNNSYTVTYSDNLVNPTSGRVDASLLTNSLHSLSDVIASNPGDENLIAWDVNAAKWVSRDPVDWLNNLGMYIASSSYVPPGGYGSAPTSGVQNWFATHANTYTVSWGSIRDATDGPYRWYRARNGNWTNTGIPEALHIDGLKHPDLTVKRGVTYYFDCTDSTLNFTDSNGTTAYLQFWITTEPMAAQTGDAHIYTGSGIVNNGAQNTTLTWTVDNSAPDYLYYTTNLSWYLSNLVHNYHSGYEPWLGGRIRVL